jgi:hypothetical protein
MRSVGPRQLIAMPSFMTDRMTDGAVATTNKISALIEGRRVRILTTILEEGHLIAKLIPGAHFVELPGNNHVLLEGTPAFDQFFSEVSAFLASQNR